MNLVQHAGLESPVMKPTRPLKLLATAGLLASLALAPLGAQTERTRYSAFAVDMTGIMGATTTPLDIVITHWATSAENAQVMNILGEQGAAKLLDYLRKAPRVGGVAAPGSLGIDIRFARRTPGASGAEQVLLLADRAIGPGEAATQSRSLDYPFTLVELKLDSTGRGEGTLTLAAKIGLDRFTKNVVLENLVDQPIRLNTVKREAK
jgi:hypothetical protein